MFYSPLIFGFILIFFFLGLLLFALIEIGVITYVFQRIGIAPEYMFLFLFLSLFGSFVNIPLYRIPQEVFETERVVSYFGVRYLVPAYYRREETVIAVNLGGAVVPSAISLYLLFRNPYWFEIILGIIFVSLVLNRLAVPISGLGIAVPAFLPPIIAALFAVFFVPRSAAAAAYISGTLGTLIGADIMNLRRVAELKAPIISIGGAGTFDGIFVTGILAVILASL